MCRAAEHGGRRCDSHSAGARREQRAAKRLFGVADKQTRDLTASLPGGYANVSIADRTALVASSGDPTFLTVAAFDQKTPVATAARERLNAFKVDPDLLRQARADQRGSMKSRTVSPSAAMRFMESLRAAGHPVEDLIDNLPTETRLGWATAGRDPILLATLSHDADDLIVERVAGNQYSPADLLTKLWNEHPCADVRARAGQTLYSRENGVIPADDAYTARHPVA